ncbi:hypothetical protein [Streptomyces thioluteus]|uniref:hypothetical protein n=1 Tax=Streptomyces thioluteus TaxID=66431 RepID=UPI0031EDEF07
MSPQATGDPVRTAERIITHPATARTALTAPCDLGRYQTAGTSRSCGRTDFQVKINGYRVELGEIEHPAAPGGRPARPW